MRTLRLLECIVFSRRRILFVLDGAMSFKAVLVFSGILEQALYAWLFHTPFISISSKGHDEQDKLLYLAEYSNLQEVLNKRTTLSSSTWNRMNSESLFAKVKDFAILSELSVPICQWPILVFNIKNSWAFCNKITCFSILETLQDWWTVKTVSVLYWTCICMTAICFSA